MDRARAVSLRIAAGAAARGTDRYRGPDQPAAGALSGTQDGRGAESGPAKPRHRPHRGSHRVTVAAVHNRTNRRCRRRPGPRLAAAGFRDRTTPELHVAVVFARGAGDRVMACAQLARARGVAAAADARRFVERRIFAAGAQWPAHVAAARACRARADRRVICCVLLVGADQAHELRRVARSTAGTGDRRQVPGWEAVRATRVAYSARLHTSPQSGPLTTS